ncbi:MAG: DUF2520 domain-containing protein, partial [Chloroflexota bacterium]
MTKVGFIGAGKVGTALAVKLGEQGYPVVAVASRSLSSAQKLSRKAVGSQVYNSGQEVADKAELVFITTPDDQIGPVAASISWRRGQKVVHCSGAASLDILEPARELGAHVGGFHPLQTFAGIDQALENLPGSFFALEGDEEIKEELRKMALALNGQCVELGAGDKALYHLSAVIACNYWVTLVQVATDLWAHFGKDTSQALKALLPLLRGTLNNLAQVGLPQARPGPIARGDVTTIKKHLQVMEEKAPHLLSLYRELGLHTIPIGKAKGALSDPGA